MQRSCSLNPELMLLIDNIDLPLINKIVGASLNSYKYILIKEVYMYSKGIDDAMKTTHILEKRPIVSPSCVSCQF